MSFAPVATVLQGGAKLRAIRSLVHHPIPNSATELFSLAYQDQAWNYLVRDKDFSSSTAEEVHEGVKQGRIVLIDVRPIARHEQGHPTGAVSVQMYQKTDFSKPSFSRYFKALALMANGVEPMESNPDFMEQLKAASGGKAVCLMCETGGTLKPSASFPLGKTSRSLQATHRTHVLVGSHNVRGGVQAIESGDFPDVLHLQGGTLGWVRAGLPFDGEYDQSQAGRVPSVVE